MKLANIVTILLLACTSGAYGYDRCTAARSVVAPAGGDLSPSSAGAAASADLVLIPSPVVTAGDAAARSTVELATYPYGSVQEFDFSSDAGAGKWSVSKQGGKTYVTLKVKFNYAMPMDDFVYGSEFTAPFNINARVKRAFDACVRAARRVMGAGADIKLSGDKPYLHAPVMNYAARVSVSKEAPSAVGANVAHDMSLFDGSGKPMSFYQKAANRAGMTFTVGDWWTFVIEEKNNLKGYQAWFAKTVNLQGVLADQPLQYMVKDKAQNKYLMSLDLWTPAVATGFDKRYCSN